MFRTLTTAALVALTLTAPVAAHADPVEDQPGGTYVKVVDTRPAGAAIRVTLANATGVPIRTDILRPCRFEDGRRCYWVASERGNGIGRDFVVMSGTVFPVDLSWIGDAR